MVKPERSEGLGREAGGKAGGGREGSKGSRGGGGSKGREGGSTGRGGGGSKGRARGGTAEYFQFLSLHWRRVARAYPALTGLEVGRGPPAPPAQVQGKVWRAWVRGATPRLPHAGGAGRGTGIRGTGIRGAASSDGGGLLAGLQKIFCGL